MTSNSSVRSAGNDSGGNARTVNVKTKKAANKSEKKNAVNTTSNRARGSKNGTKKADQSAKTTSAKTNFDKYLKKYDSNPADANSSRAGSDRSRIGLAAVGVFGLLIGFLVGKNIK